ncbi:DNA repair protein XRCC3 isoform X3 [Pteropus medius]|uniref:DNA repair protein XRCC3 isoform X3 n=1 Tax=Pteropus vampyrus TaxID=132908 RepID=UPI00196A7131|nr:DNA repair protein XRCC3 isoform X3 [Pteropus giganteus]
MDLDQLDLNPRIIAAIKKAKLNSVKEVLHFSGPDLQRLTGLSGPDVQHLLRAASSHLRGSGVLTGAVYICTEDAFPSQRLQQLIAQQQCLRADVPGEVVRKIKFSNQIFIKHAADVDALLECVRRNVPVLLSRGMVRLVVIDSVAAPFRCEPDGPASAPRARRLQALGAALRRLSCTFQSPVLCINQVGPPPPELGTTAGQRLGGGAAVWGLQLTLTLTFQVTEAVQERDAGPALGPCTWEERLTPALGTAWSSQLLMRLMATRHRPEEALLAPPGCPARTLRVLFAPHLPPSSCSYTVNAEGVRGTPGTESC